MYCICLIITYIKIFFLCFIVIQNVLCRNATKMLLTQDDKLAAEGWLTKVFIRLFLIKKFLYYNFLTRDIRGINFQHGLDPLKKSEV